MAIASEADVTGIEIRALHPAIGAEVRGLDLRRPLGAEQQQAVHQAWMDHLVLVFPGQAIADAEQIAFSRGFGELEVHHQKIIRSARAPEIFRVANVDDDGTLLRPGNPIVEQLAQTRRWHTDSSFRPVPSMGSILRGLEVSHTGGLTCFANMYAVLEALPGHLRAKIEGRKARHDFGFLHSFAKLKPLSAAERAAMPPVWQPMTRRHPVTGRASLYISPIYNDQVEGMSAAEASEFIQELGEFAGRDEFVFRHRWESDDMVMWDNRCTMHLVTPYDPEERRIMHRTTIAGEEAVIAA